jgi:hypothetical protein
MENPSWGRFQFQLRRLFFAIGAVGVGLGLLVGAARAYRAWLYPYGWSHCCDTGLYLGLRNYASSHGGAFPAGEPTSEASLSLLYPKLADADLLRGKTVPLAVAQAALDKNGRLDPTSCGWHYVEGLTESDDSSLALFWDKVGLGHNGERLSAGGHWVHFISGTSEYIAEDQWPAFLDKQKKLLAERRSKATSRGAKPAVK